MNRRYFLRNASALALGFVGLRNFAACSRAVRPTEGYGELLPDLNGVMDLPQHFSYQIISRAGMQMDDGFIVPTKPDGMATFAGPEGRTLIVRNHEINVGAEASQGAFGNGNALLERLSRELLYDAGANGSPALGGTTTLVYDTRMQRLERQFLSLAGTARNCAGGPTPWNSWITCEETVDRAGDVCAKDHGYAFEVPATAEPRLASPLPLLAMGRFNHEAVAVHAGSGIVYQTEDRSDGLIYRYLPNQRGVLSAGGRLQALSVIDQPSLDTRNWDIQQILPDTKLAVKWIDLDETDSPEDDLRQRGFARSASKFARGEGMWSGQDAIYFACTNGGLLRKGQIWRYIPSPHEGTVDESKNPGTLQLFIEPNDSALVDNADNLTVAPWGDLIVCEDGSGEQFLVGVTPKGECYKLARNAMPGNSELAGVTFSPDGSTLFVNIQHNGLTLAITGPWR